MGEWIKQVASVSLLISIISIVIPSGRLGVYIKSIFGVVVFFVMIKPISILKNQDFSVENSLTQGTIVENQDKYEDFIVERKIEQSKTIVEKILEAYGIKKYSINIRIIYENFYYIQKIDIEIKEYLDKDKHKDIIDGIIYDTSAALSVDKNAISVKYGEQG